MVRRLGKIFGRIKTLKRLVYLISPSKIGKNFYQDLDRVLSFQNVEILPIKIKKYKYKKNNQNFEKNKKNYKKT